MKKREEALLQAKRDIFSEIMNSVGNYSSFSSVEKLQFIERAFIIQIHISV